MENKALQEGTLDPTFQQLLHDFYTDLILVERRAELSAETYECSAEEFLKWLTANGLPLAAVTTRDIILYLRSRQVTAKCSELTIAKDISSLRAFGSYLKRKTIWNENYALELDRPKAARALPRVLSIYQVDRL